MPKIHLITMTSLICVAFAARAQTSPDRFQGVYSMKTEVLNSDARTEAECANSVDSRWNAAGEVCVFNSSNDLNIAQILSEKNSYGVAIDIMSYDLNMCEFVGKFKAKGGKLVYHSKAEKCSVEIVRTKNGARVIDHGCSQKMCGQNANLDIDGGVFKREGDQPPVETEDDLALKGD